MIEVDNLSKSYGSRRALDGVTFVAPDGKITGFVGPNGAGKSTVMRVIAGLCAPDAGTVRVDGRPFALTQRPASTLGVFLSAEWIPPGATPRGLLEYACDTQAFSRSRVSEVLSMVGLEPVATKRVGSFSLGMRQRLGIAAAMLGRPTALLLDEPVNGLDPDGVHWLRTFLQQSASAGVTVLLSSHMMTELALIADHVVMLSNGRVVANGPLTEVGADRTPSVYAASPDPGRVREALAEAGYVTEPARAGFLIHGADPLEVGRIAFATGAGLTHLERHGRSLEETYFEMLSAAEGKAGA